MKIILISKGVDRECRKFTLKSGQPAIDKGDDLNSKRTAYLENRPFQALLMDADIHLKTAAQIWSQIEGSRSTSEMSAIPHDIPRSMRAASRACIVTAVAGVEAFMIWTFLRMCKRDPGELNEKWLRGNCRDRNNNIRPFVNWELKDKLWLLPSMCGEDALSPESVFDRQSRNYNRFVEYVKIRNSIAHGHEFETVYEIDVDTKAFDDEARPTNFWNLTKVPRDICSIGFSDAEKAYENCIWAIQILVGACNGRINRSHLLEQTLDVDGESGKYGVLRESISDEIPDWVKWVLGPQDNG